MTVLQLRMRDHCDQRRHREGRLEQVLRRPDHRQRNCSSLVILVVVILIARIGVWASKASGSDHIELDVVVPLHLTPLNPAGGQVVTASFTIRNIGTRKVQLDRLGVGGRGPGCGDWSCQNYQDFPFHQQAAIAPGQAYTYTEQRLFLEEGAYFAQIAYESPSGAWFFLGNRVDFDVSAGLLLAQQLSLLPAKPQTNELVFAEYQLHNASGGVLTFERVGVGARGPDCTLFDWGCLRNVDFVYEEQISLNPGDTRRFVSWRLFAEPGSYFAQVSVQDHLGEWHQLGSPTTFTNSAAVYTPRDSDWQLGVHFHPTWSEDEDDARLVLARAAGIDVVRIGASWHHLEPSAKGEWDHDWYIPSLDRVVSKANALGMEVYILLLQVPCWASSDPTKDCVTSQWDDAYPPLNHQDYADAFGRLLELFGDRVDVWEVWNEPNIERFWKPVPDARAYTQLLQTTYRTIKSRDPDSIVLGGSLAGADTAFLYAMYEAGAKDSFDALALHPYSGGAPDECADLRWAYQCGVDAIRSMMLHYGDSKDVHFTEFGWSSYNGPGGVGELSQRVYLQEALTLLELWDFVRVATWYNLVDTDFNLPNLPHEDYFGLHDRALRTKPSAAWLRISHFPHNVYLPVCSRYASYQYLLRKGVTAEHHASLVTDRPLSVHPFGSSWD